MEPAKAAPHSAVAAQDWAALHQLYTLHWARLDRLEDGPLHELYTEDGEMLIGALTIRGHAALAEYFTARFAAETAKNRHTRHIASGFRIQAMGPDDAIIHSIVCVFSGHGTLPLPSTPPSTVADFTDLCRRGADGAWRFARRAARVVFLGADAPAFARIAPGVSP